jgi:hypothetical protein
MSIRVLSPLIRIPASTLPGVLHFNVVKAGSLGDVPVRRRVQIVEAAVNAHRHIFPNIGLTVRWLWSAPNGDCFVDDLDPSKRYHAIAYDHTGEHHPTILWWLTPEVPE